MQFPSRSPGLGMLRNYVAIAANTGRGGHGVMRSPIVPGYCLKGLGVLGLMPGFEQVSVPFVDVATVP